MSAYTSEKGKYDLDEITGVAAGSVTGFTGKQATNLTGKSVGYIKGYNDAFTAGTKAYNEQKK